MTFADVLLEQSFLFEIFLLNQANSFIIKCLSIWPYCVLS